MDASLAIHATAAQSNDDVAKESGRSLVVLSRASVCTTAPVAFAFRRADTTATTLEGLAGRIATRLTVWPSIAGRPVRKTATLSARPSSPVATWSVPMATVDASTRMSGARGASGGGAAEVVAAAAAPASWACAGAVFSSQALPRMRRTRGGRTQLGRKGLVRTGPC